MVYNPLLLFLYFGASTAPGLAGGSPLKLASGPFDRSLSFLEHFLASWHNTILHFPDPALESLISPQELWLILVENGI